MKSLRSFLCSAALSLPFVASAHPGHSATPLEEAAHWFFDASHLIVVLGVGLLAALTARTVARRRAEAN